MIVELSYDDELRWRPEHGKAHQAEWFEANGVQIRTVASGTVVVDTEARTIAYQELQRGADGKPVVVGEGDQRQAVLADRVVPLAVPLPEGVGAR